MSTVTAKRAALKSSTVLKGKRAIAFDAIAALSMAEDTSRAASIANMKAYLGPNPSMDETKAGKRRWIIGRVASRLPANALPKGHANTPEGRIDAATALVTQYAYPAKDGSTAKLKKGQLGHRTPTQHKIVRAAEEAASVFMAELGLSNAKTTSQRDAEKKTRAPSMAGSGKGKAAAPDHSQLVKPLANPTEEEAINYLMTQGTMLLQFSNKNAKVIPAAIGQAVQAFKSALNKEANAAAERRAAAAAAKK